MFKKVFVLIFSAFILISAAEPLVAEPLAEPPSAVNSSAQEKEPGDLVITGPEGLDFVFRPVSLGLNGGPLASRRFVMGDPSLGFRAYPTAVALGGAFLSKTEGGPETGDWVYYLGKYEVTEGQYYAVMGLPESKDSELYKSRKPITNISYFEALAFVDKLNQWLLTNAPEKLPSTGDLPGFIRLPTEPEWEFAARGGVAAAGDLFDRRHPYGDRLTAHEWFAGPKSSNNKVQDVGKLQPNMLGIHDMLGNVSEMTGSLYQLEYYQGRGGGLTAKGGHFFTAEKDLGSAMRTEEPFYIGNAQKGFKPNKKPTMGLRLALGSAIMTSRAEIEVIEEAWDDYRAHAGAAMPAAVSTAPTGTQTDVRAADAKGYMKNLKSRLEKLSVGEQDKADLNRDLGFIETSLADIDRIRKQADDDAALSWVRMGNLFARHITREEEKLIKLAPLLKVNDEEGVESANSRRLAERKVEIEANIDEAFNNYLDAIKQMSKMNQESIVSAWSKHGAYLEGRAAGGQGDLEVLNIFTRHYAEFYTKKAGDPEKWRREFKATAEANSAPLN